MLQCVAVCCSVLKCVEVCCSVLHYFLITVCSYSVLQCGAVCCSVVAVYCSVLQRERERQREVKIETGQYCILHPNDCA